MRYYIVFDGNNRIVARFAFPSSVRWFLSIPENNGFTVREFA